MATKVIVDPFLKGKTALITGASRGIGFACAKVLASKGAKIAICSRNRAEIQMAADDIKRKTEAEVFCDQADMSKAGEIEEFVDSAERALGPVDILVLNGPQPTAGPFLYHNMESWAEALNMTILYMVRLLYRIVPGMKGRSFGRCIMIGSSFHLEPSSEFVQSSSIRLAQVGVFKCLARDLAAANVTFNTICPGYADTSLTRSCAAQVGHSTGTTTERVMSDWASATPMGRFIRPEEVGRVAAYLAAPESCSITGQVIAVDGAASRSI